MANDTRLRHVRINDKGDFTLEGEVVNAKVIGLKAIKVNSVWNGDNFENSFRNVLDKAVESNAPPGANAYMRNFEKMGTFGDPFDPCKKAVNTYSVLYLTI